jgi:hypothetical protein
MYPLQELFNRQLILGIIANFLSAPIPQEYPADRIVLPPSQLGSVEGKL